MQVDYSACFLTAFPQSTCEEKPEIANGGLPIDFTATCKAIFTGCKMVLPAKKCFTAYKSSFKRPI
jgi:hypothetical protein